MPCKGPPAWETTTFLRPFQDASYLYVNEPQMKDDFLLRLP